MALGPLGCVSLDEIEVPALPGDDWVRIETTLSGICGSDLAAVTAHDSFTLEPFGAYPFVFGHENVGRVVEAGPGAGDWRPGDRVIVNPMLSCLQRGLEPPCAACASGEYGLCRRTTEGVVGGGPMIGYSPGAGGGWSSGFVAHKSQLHSAEGLSDEVAVLTDPFVSALRPVLLHPPAADDVVLVIGAGSIGLLTIVALRAVGFEGTIAVLGRYDFQFEKAQAAGANVLLRDRNELYEWAAGLPGAVAYKPTLADRFVEGGPSIVYDTVGSETTIGDGVALTREAGRLILVGGAAKTSVDWTRVWYRQITVAGIFAYGLAPFEGERRDIYEIAIELLRRRDYGELGLLTHVFELEDYRAALHAALSKGGHRSIKVAIRPHAGR
ncbi:MAG: zinc-dependent alcohol dehydrogenase [Longimicrobiales bacterium]